MGRNDQTLVIGLGRFGRAIAETLGQLGHEVLGVDAAARTVQACSTSMTHVVQADASHSEIYWAQRLPGALQLVLGRGN